MLCKEIGKRKNARSYQNSNMAKVQNIEYMHASDEQIQKVASAKEAARYICENLLTKDVSKYKTLFYITFSKNYNYYMLAQNANGYCSFILFGYGVQSPIYNRRTNGQWYNEGE